MRKAVAIVALAAAALCGCGSDGGDEELGQSVNARVVRVVDGDTIEVSIAGDEEDVRYIGIDTPETVKPGEPVQCYGPEASAFNHRLVEGETVRLVFDHELRDVYGRLLAYVYVGDRFVNAALVRGGYARTLEIPPNTTRADRLAGLEQRAGRDGIGLWGAC
ncbi:MAG TPA: thermonuclease family protein [Solirubrobacterales bacterium]|nr:thermonuclease family protein [Solirubrobacterales bacterium]